MSQVNVTVNETTQDILVTISEQGLDGVGVPQGGLIGQVLKKVSGDDYATEWADEAAALASSWGGISGTLSNQTDLQNALNAKANTSHTHVKADITDFAHNHDDRYYTESEITTLLSGKAASSHTHIIGDTTGLQAALDSKAASTHTHVISDTTGLQTALDGKASSVHTHVIADVTSLQTSLDAKAADNLVVKLAGAQSITGEKTFSALTTIDAALRQRVPANRQTASYTLVLADEGKLVETNVASANNLTVPPNSSVAFPVGTQVLVSQYGAGQTTIVAGSGVTLRSSGTKLKLSAQYAIATLIKIATDEWMLSGDLVA
jgi:hypothetical protein